MHLRAILIQKTYLYAWIQHKKQRIEEIYEQQNNVRRLHREEEAIWSEFVNPHGDGKMDFEMLAALRTDQATRDLFPRPNDRCTEIHVVAIGPTFHPQPKSGLSQLGY
ncbi:hypothetical protein SLA2020_511110 [Shorea laevis]